jgi:hypothetical protein
VFKYQRDRSNRTKLFRFRFVVFNAIFNNISVILWWSVLLVEETGVPGSEKTTDLSQITDKLYHIMLYKSTKVLKKSFITSSINWEVTEWIFSSLFYDHKSYSSIGLLLSSLLSSFCRHNSFYSIILGAVLVVIVIVWLLDLQLPVQLEPITTKVVSSNRVHCEVYFYNSLGENNLSVEC